MLLDLRKKNTFIEQYEIDNMDKIQGSVIQFSKNFCDKPLSANLKSNYAILIVILTTIFTFYCFIFIHYLDVTYY